MNYLLAWLEPVDGSPYPGFRSKTVKASSDERAMVKLLQRVDPEGGLPEVDPEELENTLDELYERGVNRPLLVYNLDENTTVVSMEEDSY